MTKPRPRALLAVALLFLTPSLLAQPAAHETWFTVETPRFVFLSNAEPKVLAAAAAELDHQLDLLTAIGGEPPPTQNVVYLFRDPASFAPFRSPNTYDGYALASENVSYAAFASLDQDVVRQGAVSRQLLIQVLHRGAPRLPLWLRTGLVEFHANLTREGDVLLIGAATTELHHFGPPLMRGLFDWSQFWTATQLPADQSEKALFQTASFVTVHWLLDGDEAHRAKLAQLIARLGNEEDPAAAYKLVYGRELASLPANVVEHLTQWRDKGVWYAFQVRLPEDSKRLAAASRPLSPAAYYWRLGDLLSRVGRGDPSRMAAARAYLQRATELDPALAPAWLRLAEVIDPVQQPAEALPALRKAAELQPSNSMVQLLLGEALLRTLPRTLPLPEPALADARAARSAFERADALAPNEPRAVVGLATTWTFEATPPAAVFERALAVAPERDDLAANLLLCHVRAENGPAARQVLRQMVTRPADPALLTFARDTLHGLELRQAARLAQSGKNADALGTYARLLAESPNPDTQRQATEYLAKTFKATQLNRFATLYRRALDEINTGNLPAASATLRELAPLAAPGSQQEAVEALTRRLGGDFD